MTMHYAGASAPELVSAPSTLEAYAASAEVDRPTLFVSTDLVADKYRALAEGLGDADIHYAVKANPDPKIIERLADLGANFDAASRGEIALCLGLGVAPDRISYGNTIKRASDIAYAHRAGITLFAADAAEEIEKIADNAPGARVFVRLLVDGAECDWPLSRKFGCDPRVALRLLDLAKSKGLQPVGFSFHVGSQTRRAELWAPALDGVAQVWRAAAAAGHDLTLLNIGGGFPAFYGEPVQRPKAYAREVVRLVRERFGDEVQIIAEPGRGLVGEAGVIACEVVLASKKSDTDLHRWVYLDIGKFSGLAETMDEAIRYQFLTARDGDPVGPCILAGPSCDSVDVLYEERPVLLPLTLKAGDRVLIRNTGAYTSSYSSVGFNGFPPLEVVVF
ncbi:MAG: type III PLP-dependent enzyme [Pseudomonadota bacterium]